MNPIKEAFYRSLADMQAEGLLPELDPKTMEILDTKSDELIEQMRNALFDQSLSDLQSLPQFGTLLKQLNEIDPHRQS